MTRVCRHCKMTKCVFFVRHCEQILQKFAWQSTNLNANLPMDCHEFARLRFANSRNDKTLVIPTCLCYPLLFLVILRYAQYDNKIAKYDEIYQYDKNNKI